VERNEKSEKCKNCNGTGSIPDMPAHGTTYILIPVVCPICKGRGVIKPPIGPLVIARPET